MILGDTSGLYELADIRAPRHAQALACFGRIIASGEPVVVHDWIVAECAALLQNRLGISPATAFLGDIAKFRVQWITPELAEQAIALHASENRRELSLVDCASLVVMKRLRIATYFGYDDHFQDFGFKPYPGL